MNEHYIWIAIGFFAGVAVTAIGYEIWMHVQVRKAEVEMHLDELRQQPSDYNIDQMLAEKLGATLIEVEPVFPVDELQHSIAETSLDEHFASTIRDT